MAVPTSRKQSAGGKRSGKRAREAEQHQREALEARIEEMNRNSAPPEAAYGAHTVHTDDGPFVLATLSQCWSCEYPVLLPNADSARPGRQHMSAPALEVKREVGPREMVPHQRTAAQEDSAGRTGWPARPAPGSAKGQASETASTGHRAGSDDLLCSADCSGGASDRP
jgi:hypothetical protein